MMKFGDDVDSKGYEYRPLSQNSNSFAAGALRRGGFLGPGTVLPEIFDRLFAVDPVSGQTHRLKVPGFDQHLANPLDETAPSLQRSGAPFVPANARTAGNEQDTFERRFVNPSSERTNTNRPAWMDSIGETSGDAGRKPVRYLGRRSANSPDPSSFEVGAPAVPFAPPNEALSSDRGSFDRAFGNWTSSPGGTTPRNPHLPLPSAVEPGRPQGIFSGTPVPLWVTLPPASRAPGRSEALGIGGWPAVPLGLGGRKSQLPADNAIPMGLPGRLAALTGVDPDNPDRPVPPPGGLLALLLAAQQR